MKGYLLDSHVLLWWLSDPDRLSESTQARLRSKETPLFFSAAAAWELAIKKQLGRLEFPGNLAEVLERERILVLPVQLAHTLGCADLPLHHRDPFDRIQIVQARVQQLTLISADEQFCAYDVELVQA